MSGSGKDIFDVFPTPMAKQLMKTRLATAQKGHDVLERKVKVLEMRYRKVAKDIIQTKELLGNIFKDASLLHAEAKYVSGDFNQTVLNGVEKARLTVANEMENVAGIKLAKFKLIANETDMFSLTGLAKGGGKINTLKESYADAVELLVELASLQTAFKTLDEQIKSIKRRVNALEQNYIPKCQRTMQYIVEEMDDRERQDFYRLKKIKDIKKRIMEEKKELENNEKSEAKVKDDHGLVEDLKDIVFHEDLTDILKKMEL